MTRRNEAIIGAPCWLDLSTPDLPRAVTFYRDLFGWTITDTSEDTEHYHIASLDGQRIGGMMAQDSGHAGEPPSWLMFLASADIEQTVAVAREHGGSVTLDPIDVGDQGRMAILADPAGAAYGVWQPLENQGFGVVDEHGAPTWFALASFDFDACVTYYPAVHGGEITPLAGPGYVAYTVEQQPRCGIMNASGVLPDTVPSNWSPFFRVDDFDQTAQRVQELGGTLLTPIGDNDGQRNVMIADPTGAAFWILS